MLKLDYGNGQVAQNGAGMLSKADKNYPGQVGKFQYF
jgi:hypothetical protein